ncbi:hypothetical protein GCM10010430_70800 [Kitasatospora cystarginea]|uniref:site-specific DNA-methyltransferase (adenine-specific) n=1 Tax=Kitasatospora cystarginea TaxID=58350 RepID=A0ABP5RTT9_9ACTN
MSTDFDSFSNRGEYFSAHYFAEQLELDLKKGLFTTWGIRESDDLDNRVTPRELLRQLRRQYLTEDGRTFFADTARLDAEDDLLSRTYGDPEWTKRLTKWHRQLLSALGYPAGPTEITVHRSGREHTVPVAYYGDGIVALDCGWAADNDAALDHNGAAKLLNPLRLSAAEAYESGPELASWLFHSNIGDAEGPTPRFILLLVGGVIVLADCTAWGEGRYLAANIDAALERNDRRQSGELATIAALFSHDMLRPGDNGESPTIDALLKASTDNAVGVSGELRHGLQRSVEILANEVLARLAETGLAAGDIEDGRTSIAKELTRESLRYLYRILFLLFAEARPELGILPADDGSYEAGYSMARLRELVERDEELIDPEARDGFHLYESLDVLFAKVNYGHRPYGSEADDDQPGDDNETRAEKAARRSQDRGLRFEPLRSELFEPKAIRLIGTEVLDPRVDEHEDPRWLDLRPRNSALHEILRLLTMKRGGRRGERGGFISYRNLGINQLGAVYEGLMSFTGFIAEEELLEVAKGGKTDNGSWMIPASRQDQYPDDVFVQYSDDDARKGLRGRKKYPKGSFVYRLAGRDRQTTASYYTPESLTKVTVELALKHRLDQQRDEAGNVVKTRASELLKYKICEPALGSGAFLNEAINQVAKEYLKRRQDELGTSIPASEAVTEERRAKAYIALHNAYGVDLNATGVELAEVSLWLNTMHPGMRAPWFGLHLRRGNSLIGARRAVYAAEDVAGKEKAWLKAKGALAPTEIPFLKNGLSQPLPDGAVHQFLLPAVGWGAVASEKEAKSLAAEDSKRLATWKRGILKPPSAKAPRGKASELARLQAVARRAEYLWALVVRRMEISEREISRRIDVWGADPGDAEYAFLARPDAVVPKEKVYADLFEATGTPYWRLKTVMDTWCALWFWPVKSAGLLDGSDTAYVATGRSADSALAGLPQVGEPTVAAQAQPVVTLNYTAQPLLLTMDGVQESLLTAMADAQSVTAAGRTPITRKPRGKTPARRAAIPLASMADWLDFAEAVLGAHDVPADSLVSQFKDLDQLEPYEDSLPSLMGMDSEWQLASRFPWLTTVREIATEQGFLHWELDFAVVFARLGGFDLQVGNPPWVRPDWNEPAVLAEHEPWFMLAEKASASEKENRREELLNATVPRTYLLSELTTTSATVAYLGSALAYPLLDGTRPDLYRAFMCRTWSHAAARGTVGLVHPDTHFNGDREASLREAAYTRLRVHGDFVNAGNRFFPPPVGRSSHFGVHIYGSVGEIGFDHLSWLFSVDALRLSATAPDDPTVPDPGVRFGSSWDERPHRKRIVRVDEATLAQWQRLTGEQDQSVRQARLLSPVSTAEADAIKALAQYPWRLADLNPQISAGYNEALAKTAGLIDYNRASTEQDNAQYAVTGWNDVILKGPQLGVANSMFKQPSQGASAVLGLNLQELPSGAVPESEYRRVASSKKYVEAQDRWIDYQELERLRNDEREISAARAAIAEIREIPDSEVGAQEIDEELTNRARYPYSDFFRLAWRRQIAPDTERSLYAALLPKGPTHVHGIHSAALPTREDTVLTAGFWAALPVDYFLRTSGRGDLQVNAARIMPAASPGHPLASALCLRVMRLNCLTDAYQSLWAELYDPSWASEQWAVRWSSPEVLHTSSSEWTEGTPLRSDCARRAALVEIDALVAAWLGVSADALIAMYRARFPILQDFDSVTWFDARGRKIAGNRYSYGHGQTKEHYEQLLAFNKVPESPPPAGYTPSFYKADREREMREAHAVFQARLDAAVARGEWDPVRQEVPSK